MGIRDLFRRRPTSARRLTVPNRGRGVERATLEAAEETAVNPVESRILSQHPSVVELTLVRAGGVSEEGDQILQVVVGDTKTTWELRAPELIVTQQKKKPGDLEVFTRTGMELIGDSSNNAVLSRPLVEASVLAASELGTQLVLLHPLSEGVVEKTGYRIALMTVSNDVVFDKMTNGPINRIYFRLVFGPSVHFPEEVVDAMMAQWEPGLERFHQGRAGTRVLFDVFERLVLRLSSTLPLERLSQIRESLQIMWKDLDQSHVWPPEWDKYLSGDPGDNLPGRETAAAAQPGTGPKRRKLVVPPFRLRGTINPGLQPA